MVNEPSVFEPLKFYYISILEAVGAIWALSFDAQNRKLMVENEEMEVISTLLNLKTVNHDKIKLSANGALWNLREDLEKTEKFHEIGMLFSCISAGTHY